MELNDHEAVLKEIGQKLTDLRKKNGHTSYETFAIEHNLSRMQYWRIEKGKTNITVKSLVRILNIHGVKIDDFFREEELSRNT